MTTEESQPMTDPVGYWNKLHSRRDLSSVGQSGLPASMNRWLYRAHERQVRRLADDVDLHPKHVYEVGAGTGYWTRFWRRRGAEVSGSDIAPLAVSRLRT